MAEAASIQSRNGGLYRPSWTSGKSHHELAIAEFALLKGLSPDELQFMKPYLDRQLFPARHALYHDGQTAIDAQLAAILAARHHIHLETFIFQPDVLGCEFLCLLADGGWKYLSTQAWAPDLEMAEKQVEETLWW